MIPFVLTAVLLTAIGLWPLLGLLRDRKLINGSDRGLMNWALHQDHLETLSKEISQPRVLDEITAETERQLLDDLERTAEEIPLNPSSGRPVLIGLIALMPLVAGLVYVIQGHPELLENPPLAQAERDQAVIRQLAERLQQNPSDLEGWVLLGRSLLTTRRPQEAARALETATRLSPENPDIAVLWAEALAESQQGRLEGTAAKTLENVLKQHPEHRMALWLGGLAAAQAGELETARTRWLRLRAGLEPGSPEQQEIDGYLSQLGPTVNDSEAPVAAGVKVRVLLDSSLKGQTQADDTVFIFARRPSGPPMPLAVVRKRVADLPLEVLLDDRLAMRPGLEISGQSEVVVGARISKSGEPTAHSGDFEGFSGPVRPGDPTIKTVTIDQRHP